MLHDTTIGKVHVACGEACNTRFVWGLLRCHVHQRLIGHFRLLLGLHLPRCTDLFTAIGFRHGQSHDVRVFLVHHGVLLQRLVWQLGQTGCDLLDVNHDLPSNMSAIAKSINPPLA